MSEVSGVRCNLCGSGGVQDINGKLLQRHELVGRIIGRLDERKVLVVTGPPMTGKTSLARLVCSELNSNRNDQKNVILHLSAVGLAESMRSGLMFREAFLKATDIDWGKVTEDIPGSETGVYLIVDEIQAFYKRGDLTSASLSSYEFWKLVTRVSTTTVKRMHVMMLAGDGSSGYYADLEPPVLITTKERHMGVSDINFNQDEIRGYVVARFEKQVLCGGHVGICTSAIDVMNQIARSRVQSVNRYPTAQEWRYYPVYDKVNYKSSRQYSPKAQMLP